MGVSGSGLSLAAPENTSEGGAILFPTSTPADQFTTATPPPPHFDLWADQPRLNCSLPAIRAWQVVRHVNAQTDLAPSTRTSVGTPQIIFAQRPFNDTGLSKYSVIYQVMQRQPANRDAWYRVAASFYIGFLDEVRRGGDYAKIEATSPIVVRSGEIQRVYFTYYFEKKDGRKLGGAAISAPARKGVFFYNLTLEGHGREAIDAAMEELKRQVTRGLAMPTWSVTPYVIGALLVLPLGAIVFFAIRRLRGRT